MNSYLRDWLNFTRGEKSGIIFLIAAITVMIILPEFLGESKNHADFTEFEKEVDDFYAQMSLQNEFGENNDNWRIKESDLFYFDPNKIGADEWKKLGMSERQIKTILNFRAKGGKFFDAEDLGNIYGISPEQFEFLKNYVRIENTRYPNFKKQDYKEKYTTAKREPVMVDLNSATYEDLLEIRGIGPSFANRIIRYRDLLGGFISCEQLKEVYGIDEEKYSSVKDQVKADPAQINKININNATYKDLIRMPYFNKKTARDFIEYVKITGKVKEVKSLLKDNIVDEEIFKKLEPYITAE